MVLRTLVEAACAVIIMGTACAIVYWMSSIGGR